VLNLIEAYKRRRVQATEGEEGKKKTPPPGCRYARREKKKKENAARLPLLIAARTINSCATISLFPTLYIRTAAHFEDKILYS
jgi:hypothetical protein